MQSDRPEAVVSELERVLDEPLSEEEVHSFLAERPFLLNLLLPPHVEGGAIYSKVQLGSEYVTDFAAIVLRTLGPSYYLFELEMPTAPLFTKKGDFSSTLSHAIRQIVDWRRWIADHRDYADSIMPRIDDPIGVIIIGRRRGLRDSDRRRLSQFLSDNGGKIDIVTYDRILDIARLNVHGRMEGRNRMQSRAYSFDELRGHRQKIVNRYRRYLNRPQASGLE